ncbi:MAG: GTPase ObgE [Chloroflexi bacterium]|nr:GTPase ObgE [Chloroflexota bacterium]MCI0855144.1 GTPase ObgE [Chloroflexota bacterium]
MLDEVSLIVIAGNGGNGVVSFRRERYVPKGGPDGGDGGSGGSVWVEATTAVLVLDDLRRIRTARAKNGTSGGKQKRHGKNAKDLVLQVPVGTIVWDEEGKQLADLNTAGMRSEVVQGGSGGKGNARFATPIRKAPRFAERGLPGETKQLRLELRLLAEVGLVGLPNAGKSSLLQAISKARPKVGAYPFTTLEPSLGIVELNYETIVVADVPGLIEGAHAGAGLGTQFLQHIRRTTTLLHVVDISGDDPMRDIESVRGELQEFGGGLTDKRWLVALNKIDLGGTQDRCAEAEAELRRRGIETFAISALGGQGVDRLLNALFRVVMEEREATASEKETEPLPLVPVEIEEAVQIKKLRGTFVVKGKRPEEAALRLGVDSEEIRAELARRLARMGVKKALRRAGIADGDKVRIAGEELQWPL